MGSVGDAYDNAMAESFFATLECELLDRRTFKTQAEARMAVFEFIEGFYNPRRRHSSLGYLSPVDYERHHTRQADPGAHHAAVVLRPLKMRLFGEPSGAAYSGPSFGPATAGLSFTSTWNGRAVSAPEATINRSRLAMRSAAEIEWQRSAMSVAGGTPNQCTLCWRIGPCRLV